MVVRDAVSTFQCSKTSEHPITKLYEIFVKGEC